MGKYNVDKSSVRICGQTQKQAKGFELVHSGSFIEFHGEMSELNLELCGEDGEENGELSAYLGIFQDGKTEPVKTIEVKNGLHNYAVAVWKEKEEHNIKVVKLTEMQYGKVYIKDVQTDGKIKPTEGKKRKILAIGDSITAGYGVNGTVNDGLFTTKTEDVTKAYPYTVAESLDADIAVVCFSGGGIISRWIPPEENNPRTDILLPELLKNFMKMDFDPELILINLGTNDASYTRNKKDRQILFREQYIRMITELSLRYQDAYIMAVYGLMEQTLKGVVQEAVKNCQGRGIRSSFFELPAMDEKDGVGTDRHPSFLTHQKAAILLKKEIDRVMEWKIKRGQNEILSE